MTQASDLEAEGLALEEIEGRHLDVKGPDIFQRISHFHLAKQAQAVGLYPFFQPVDVNEGNEAIVNGERVLMLGSNNYLGLTRHPKVMQAAREALEHYGPSMTGSRLLNGTTALHEDLEEEIAAFLGMESALVFSTGYLANLGAISAVVDRGCTAVIDKGVHASIYDGAAMAPGATVRFRHNDVGNLEETLERLPSDVGRLVIIDGVYSMGGDVAPLPAIAEVCLRHETRLLVDDAHAIGTMGEGGARDGESLWGAGGGGFGDRDLQQDAGIGGGLLRGSGTGDGVHQAFWPADDLHRLVAAGVGGGGAGGAALHAGGAVAGGAGEGAGGADAGRAAGARVRYWG